MNLLCIGVSHHTAPVEVRERLAYSEQALRATLARFDCGRGLACPGLRELAVLSTCNRLELYAAGEAETPEELIGLVAETTGVPAAVFSPYLYTHLNDRAAEHLCRVAAGLDSLVLGEPQILGQVVGAYEMARGHGAAGPVISALFRTAIHAGKRARTETAISRNPATISSVAVALAASAVTDLTQARVLVMGAGEMATLAAEALRARGTASITVINRTHAHAAALAARWGAQTLTYEHLEAGLVSSDIVIASTGAPHVIVARPLAAAVMAQRPERPLVFIDIAVPRNVDADVATLPKVHYFDVDDLQSRLNGHLAERESQRPRVEAILQGETAEFNAWMAGLAITPLISDLRGKAESIRRAEVERTLNLLSHLSSDDQRHIEALSEALVNKLLHEPTQRLRAVSHNGHAAEYASAVRHLFALKD
jgi:glutamyl-tRNA reductase